MLKNLMCFSNTPLNPRKKMLWAKSVLKLSKTAFTGQITNAVLLKKCSSEKNKCFSPEGPRRLNMGVWCVFKGKTFNKKMVRNNVSNIGVNWFKKHLYGVIVNKKMVRFTKNFFCSLSYPMGGFNGHSKTTRPKSIYTPHLFSGEGGRGYSTQKNKIKINICDFCEIT